MHSRVKARHQKRGGSSLAGYVSERNHHPPLVALYEVVVVAANLVTWKADALKFIAVEMRRRCWKKALLYLARKLKLVLHALALHLLFQKPRVLDADGGNACERGQNLQMVFREAPFGYGRIRVDYSEDVFADSQRHGQDRAYPLNRHSAGHKARVVLRVRCEHRLSFADDLFHDGTADANLAYLALPVTKARHRNLQLRAALVPHHDKAAVCGNGFENQRSDLIESLRERGRSKQRDPHFAYQREKIALPCGM